MKQSRSKIIIEDYKNNFIYKKNETNLNIQFNRVAFIFFVFFIIYLNLHYSFNSFRFT